MSVASRRASNPATGFKVLFENDMFLLENDMFLLVNDMFLFENDKFLFEKDMFLFGSSAASAYPLVPGPFSFGYFRNGTCC